MTDEKTEPVCRWCQEPAERHWGELKMCANRRAFLYFTPAEPPVPLDIAEQEWARLEAMTDEEVVKESADRTRAKMLKWVQDARAAKARLMGDPTLYAKPAEPAPVVHARSIFGSGWTACAGTPPPGEFLGNAEDANCPACLSQDTSPQPITPPAVDPRDAPADEWTDSLCDRYRASLSTTTGVVFALIDAIKRRNARIAELQHLLRVEQGCSGASRASARHAEMAAEARIAELEADRDQQRARADAAEARCEAGLPLLFTGAKEKSK